MTEPATIPDTKPVLDGPPGTLFVPRAVNVRFKHPEYGDVCWSAEDNPFGSDIVSYSTLNAGMFVTDAKSVKKTVKAMCERHDDAVVETNYKPWGDPRKKKGKKK